MKLIATVAALAAGLVLPLAACGTPADQPTGTPDRPAIDHVAAWQAYYDATHHLRPSPAVDHVAAWQAYYDATHV